MTRKTIAAFLLLAAALLLSCPGRRPDAPAKPWGLTEGRPNLQYTFYAAATSPGGESLSYCFSWGDTSDGDWTGSYASGETATAANSWPDTGAYDIRTRVRLPDGRTSAWSDPTTFIVDDSANRAPETPARPWGPDSGWARGDFFMKSTATDPDGDSLYFRFAWGDDTSDLYNPVASGDTVEGIYGGLPPGVTVVTCQVRDRRRAYSAWSPPCTLHLRPLVDPKWHTAVWFEAGICPAVADDGTIYVTSLSGLDLYAVNRDGSVRWQRSVDIEGTVAIAPDGTLMCAQRGVGSVPNALLAVRPDGLDRWSFPVPRRIESPLAVGPDGTTYFGCNDSFLYAVDSAGQLRWRVPMTYGWFAAIALGADGTVYASLPSEVVAVENGGGVAWRRPVRSVHRGIDIAIGPDGTIYCGDTLTAIRPDGTVIWSRPSWSTAGPVVAPNGNVYQPSDEGLVAFDDRGSVLWTFIPADCDFDDLISGLAVTNDGTIYCTSGEGLFLHAVDGTGTEIWRGEVPGGEWWEVHPAVGPDGTIYLGSGGPLTAFSGTSPLANWPWPKFQRDLSNSGRAGP